jgi:predicted GIY-YIG superfamily endonuclease
MHYVYILESISTPGHFYIGYTQDLRDRVRKHQAVPKGESAISCKLRNDKSGSTNEKMKS